MSPRARGPMTPQQRAVRDRAIADEYVKGATQQHVGSRYGLSSNQVGVILRQQGVKTRPRGNPKSIPVGSGVSHRMAATHCALCSNDAVGGSLLCEPHNAILDRIVANDGKRRQRPTVAA